MLLLLVPWMLMARKRLRRGKWMSADHEGQYGKAFKFKGMQGWSGSGQLARRLRAAARRELDVYQFGVYTGGSMASIARRIRGFGHLWGFDSFSGLPSETAGVSVEGVHWRPGAFSSADALGEWDEARLLEQLTSRIRYGNLTFVPGYYNVSLTDELARTHAFQPALLVDVDVDLHSSTMQCMSWLLAHRLLVPGSFVRYDDWRASWQQYGEGKAHRELTLRHNITWRCLSGTKEWEVLAIGSYAPRPPDPRDKLACDVKPGSLCRVEHRRGGRRAPRSSD